MADPRGNVSFAEIAPKYATFKIDNSTIVYNAAQDNGCGGSGGISTFGLSVTESTDATVALCADGDHVAGRLIAVSADNFATVQIYGGCLFPGGASATLTAGAKFVGALGAASAKGYIRAVAAAGGSYVQAQAVDTQKGRGSIEDASTTTAVGVIL